MPNLQGPSTDPSDICKILIRKQLVTTARVKDVLANQDKYKYSLLKKKMINPSSADGKAAANNLDIIDILVSRKYERKDGYPGLLDEDAIYNALAEEWKIPYKKIDPLKLDLNIVTTTIPKNFAMKHLVLPIEIQDGTLTVATPDPFNIEVMDDIKRVTNLKVNPVVSAKGDIIRLINEFFGFKRSIAAAENMFAGPSVDLGNLEQYVRLKTGDELPSNDQHIVNAVNHILLYAFDQRASDVHIEPKRDKVGS